MRGKMEDGILTAGGRAFGAEDLAAACEPVCAKLLAQLPDIAPPAKVSRRFADGAKRLYARRILEERLLRIGRTAAAILLALILCFSAYLTANAQARGALVRWWKELTGSGAVYWFEGSGQASEEVVYAPGWLPDGLDLKDEALRGGFASYLYQGEAGMLAFEYSAGDVNGAYEIVGEGEGTSVSVNGLAGWLHEDEGRVNLIWTNEEAGIVFTIGSDLPADIVLRVAESVTPASP